MTVYPACKTSTHKTAENNRTIRVVALVEPDSPFPPKEIRPSNIAHVGLCFVKYLKSMSASKVSEIEEKKQVAIKVISCQTEVNDIIKRTEIRHKTGIGSVELRYCTHVMVCLKKNLVVV